MKQQPIKLPPWLPKLGIKAGERRKAHGIVPKIDGWYKSYAGKTRYICKPCSVDDAIKVLPSRLEAIRKKLEGTPAAPTARITPGSITLDQLADAYQAWLYQRLTTGVPRKLSRLSYNDIIREVDLFVEVAGGDKIADAIGPAEFSAYALKHLAGKAPVSVKRRMGYLETFANWAAPGNRKAALLVKPWQYGPDFIKPTADALATSDSPDKAYTPRQLRKAFLAVRKNPLLRAVGWLALVGAFQPKDLGLLPESLVNLETGVIHFPRGKTGVGRLCWLPPAARIAVKKYLAVRKPPSDDSAKLVLFRTRRGSCVYRQTDGEEAGHRVDVLGYKWKGVTKLPISGLRATYATYADDHPDQRAIDVVLGHQGGSRARSIRSQHYAKRFDPDRVKVLTISVLAKAFGRAK